jgi:hypothetical protein
VATYGGAPAPRGEKIPAHTLTEPKMYEFTIAFSPEGEKRNRETWKQEGKQYARFECLISDADAY